MPESPYNWACIQSGAVFQSLVNTLLRFETPGINVFGRAGRDAGLDAQKPSKTTVYQYKHHVEGSFANVLSDAKAELAKIKKYREPSHRNAAHWTVVNEWILVTNIPVNANNLTRWSEEIVPEFAAINIKAQLWSKETLDTLLTKHPQVATVFFQGRNRSFISIDEAVASLEGDELAEFGLDVALSGRDGEVTKLHGFLDGTKRLLCIHGPGGIGKSRLLIEIGNAAQNNGWQVLWANEATLSKSDNWFLGIPSSDRTLLILDEPQNPDLIRIIAEQIRTPDTVSKNWKVLLAVRSPKDPILKAVQELNDKYRDIALVLEALSKDAAEKLASDLIEKSPLSSLPLAGKKDLAGKLAQIGSRFPVWIAMAVIVLAREGNTASLPSDKQGIAAKYFDEVIRFSSGRVATEGQVETLLRWIAVYEEINLEDAALMGFLVKQVGFGSESILRECLNILVSRKFLVRRGVNNRLLSIKPDVMREHIVKRWLTNEIERTVETTPAAGELLKLILQGVDGNPIPNAHSVIKSLARAELLSRLQDTKLDFLSPLVSALSHAAEHGTTLEQRSVISFLDDIEFARVSDVLEIVRLLRLHPKPSVKVTDFFGSESEVSHTDVVAELGWALFGAARFAQSNDEQTEILKELAALSIFESEHSLRGINDGKRTDALIPRILSGENFHYEGFRDLAFELAKTYLTDLVKGAMSTPAQLNLVKVFSMPFLSLKREQMSSKAYTITSRRWFERLNNRAGDQRRILVDTLQSFLASPTGSNLVRESAWELFAVSHRGVNQALQRSAEVHAENQATGYRKELNESLLWVKQTLSSREFPLNELKAARDIWRWHHQFDDDPETKAIAQQCEEIYRANPLVDAYEVFFDFQKHKEVPARAAEAADRLQQAGTSEAIFTFLNEAKAFAPQANDWFGVLQVAERFAEKSEARAQLDDFVGKALAGEANDISFNFAVTILTRRLRNLRSTKDELGLKTELDKALAQAHSKEAKSRLVYAFYSRPHPLVSGLLIPEDLEFIARQLDYQREAFKPWQQCLLLTSAFNTKWSRFRDLCTSRFENAPDPDKLSCFQAILQQITFLDLFQTDYASLAATAAVFEWVLELMIQLPEIDEIGSHEQWELEQFTTRFGQRSLEWLLGMIEQRIALAEAKQDDDFKIVPTRFRLTKFVREIQSTDLPNQAITDQLLTLLTYADRQDMLGYILPEYATDIDPQGLVLPDLIADKLTNAVSEKIEVLKWSRIAGYYGFNSDAWRKIACAAIQKAAGFSQKDKVSIYVAILPQQVKSSSYPAGTMDPRPKEDLESRRKELEAESDPAIKPFREWHLKVAEAEYNEALARFKEEQEEAD